MGMISVGSFDVFLICAVSSMLMDWTRPSLVFAMCRLSQNVVRAILICTITIGTALRHLEAANRFVLKAEYELRMKELNHAREINEVESYSSDRKANVQIRASVSLH